MLSNILPKNLVWTVLVPLASVLSTTAQTSEPSHFEFDAEFTEAIEEVAPTDFSPEAPPETFAGKRIAFKDACTVGKQLTISAVGDVLIHGSLQIQSIGNQNRKAAHDGFQSLWHSVTPLIRQADVSYANFEGPAAGPIARGGRAYPDLGKRFDNVAYTSYPRFNYHRTLIDDLIATGIDVVSSANNHSLDRDGLGADQTIEHFVESGLPYTGTRKRGDTTSPWHTVTRTNGFTIAWLACTFSTNQIPDRHNQVLKCFEDTNEILEIVRTLSKDPSIDAVIVTPHWGNEYQHVPTQNQVSLAHRLLDAGATIVFGAHPHVVQPMEKYVTKDGRETFIIYSLGNFVSGQRELPRKSSIVLFVGLTRDLLGKVRINGVRYVPVVMNTQVNGLSFTLEPADRGPTQLHIDKLLGGGNRMKSTDSVVTNPECVSGQASL